MAARPVDHNLDYSHGKADYFFAGADCRHLNGVLDGKRTGQVDFAALSTAAGTSS